MSTEPNQTPTTEPEGDQSRRVRPVVPLITATDDLVQATCPDCGDVVADSDDPADALSLGTEQLQTHECPPDLLARKGEIIGGRKQRKDPQEFQGVMTTKKATKVPKLRATVFPREGGDPYVVDVNVDEGGTFTFKGTNMTYIIQRGSVWKEGGVYRCIVNEGNALTVSGHTLHGDDMVTPEIIHAIAENNLWEQHDDYAHRKSAWSQPQTWISLTLGIVFIGLAIWAIVKFGGGLSGIREAIDNLEVIIRQQAAPAATPEAGGHNNIAPEA